MTPKDALLEIRTVILTAPVGGYYPEERQRIDAALGCLRACASNGEVRCIIIELSNWVDTYGSERRARRHPGGFLQVRVWILDCLDKLKWKIAQKDQSL